MGVRDSQDALAASAPASQALPAPLPEWSTAPLMLHRYGEWPDMSHARRGGESAVVAAAVVLGVLGGGAVWAAMSNPEGASRPPARTSVAQRSPSATESTARPKQQKSEVHRSSDQERGGVPDRIRGLALPQSEPLSIQIHRLGVKQNLVDLGIDSTGAMEVPDDPAVAGWYTRGPTPGALGPAVIAGHVTWNQLPAVFFRLSELRDGDRVQVIREDGQTAVFSVVNVVRYPKTQFPTDEVYGRLDYAGLRLITCGGQYDDTMHRYLDNVVVFARLVGAHPTQG